MSATFSSKIITSCSERHNVSQRHNTASFLRQVISITLSSRDQGLLITARNPLTPLSVCITPEFRVFSEYSMPAQQERDQSVSQTVLVVDAPLTDQETQTFHVHEQIPQTKTMTHSRDIRLNHTWPWVLILPTDPSKPKNFWSNPTKPMNWPNPWPYLD
jgi:hypothetical protein